MFSSLELHVHPFPLKNVGHGKVLIQNLDRMGIKATSASPTGGLNCEVPL